ncbi:hypothetical protein QCA50_016186 [Cerrena zonata]|uniref:Uncharacterized protein n=1 Tax=Cerrena zonata TaxID=2478898 RepID=A0AAW0FJE4_9APHY
MPARLLAYHILALELTNLVGFITAMLGFQWYLGPSLELLINGFPLSAPEWAARKKQFSQLGKVSNTAFVFNGLLIDAMLLWRCRQIWKFTLCSRPDLVILPPACIFAASIAFGMISSTNLKSWLALVYYVLSLTLNVILTTLIVIRLLSSKIQTQAALGKGYGKHYNLICILFVESAFMNAICSICLLSSFQASNTANPTTGHHFQAWIALTPAVQACSSYLIIYRGSQGFYGSWSNDVSIAVPSSVAFQPYRVPSEDIEHEDDTNMDQDHLSDNERLLP